MQRDLPLLPSRLPRSSCASSSERLTSESRGGRCLLRSSFTAARLLGTHRSSSSPSSSLISTALLQNETSCTYDYSCMLARPPLQVGNLCWMDSSKKLDANNPMTAELQRILGRRLDAASIFQHIRDWQQVVQLQHALSRPKPCTHAQLATAGVTSHLLPAPENIRLFATPVIMSKGQVLSCIV